MEKLETKKQVFAAYTLREGATGPAVMSGDITLLIPENAAEDRHKILSHLQTHISKEIPDYANCKDPRLTFPGALTVCPFPYLPLPGVLELLKLSKAVIVNDDALVYHVMAYPTDASSDEEPFMHLAWQDSDSLADFELSFMAADNAWVRLEGDKLFLYSTAAKEGEAPDTVTMLRPWAPNFLDIAGAYRTAQYR